LPSLLPATLILITITLAALPLRLLSPASLFAVAIAHALPLPLSSPLLL
jgi:hypothetical protein